MRQRSIRTLGLISFLAICGGHAGAQDAAPAQSMLGGQWISAACEAPSASAERSIRRSFQFSDWSWRVDVAIYQGAACATPLAGISIAGVYALTGTSSVVPGAREGTFSYTRKSAAALSEAGATLLTSSKCGASVWRAGLEQDVSDTGCMGFPPITADCRQEFDVIGVKDGELRFGQRTPRMCEAAGRPVQFSAFPLVRPAAR
jgi:hypothetical protein